MYSNYFKTEGVEKAMQTFAGILIIGMLLFGSPLGFVHAEEDGGDPDPVVEITTEDPAPEETSNTEGSEGDDGTSGSEDGTAVVVTGDAVSLGEIDNEVNTNNTNTEGEVEEGGEGEEGDEGGEILDDTGSTTPEVVIENEEEEENVTTTTSVTVENENDAVVGNDADVEAETGDNTAGGGEGGAIIDTGNALASANVVNVVNTNITNSYGFLLLLNALFGSGSFDLRDFDFGWSEGAGGPELLDDPLPSPCDLDECEGNVDMTVTSTSTAQITNDVVVRSSTGGNSASGGDAYINTGNAYAGANVLNVVNTNFVDSNYLLVSLNNFGNFDGDIVFPGLSFFSQYFGGGGGGGGGQSGNIDISNTNDAEVGNEVTVGADTGNNSATSTDGSAIIDTGNAVAGANVTNVVNSNFFGGDSIQILIRIHGSWSGNIFGLPEGVSWAETPQGIQLFSTPTEPDEESGNGIAYESLGVSNNNTATVNNNVEVFALTGENQVRGSGDAIIETGNAVAGANVTNIVNTNVVGRNWILAVFNIFGDWSGNLSFGQPDLWVGARAESPNNPIRPGSTVTFRYTVTNFGDALATNVALNNVFDRDLLSFDGYQSEFTDGSGVSWMLDTLAPGETKELVYTAHVTSNLSNGTYPIAVESTLTSLETDNNIDDNNEEISIVVVKNERQSWVSQRNGLPYADLVIEKSASVVETVASSTVDYTVVVHNYGTSAYDATLYDTLRDENGETVTSQSWPLGEIYPEEEITVTYTVVFDENTVPGEYTNSAQVRGVDIRSRAKGGNANSETVEFTVTVGDAIVQECSSYLNSYIKPGADNNVEDVTKLQEFLVGEGYSLSVTGVYDVDTENAVRAFQEDYRDQILTPWNIDGPTGYVYYTTQSQINLLACGGDAEFPLSPDQQAEIEDFKERIKRLREQGEPIDTSTVGIDTTEVPVRLAQEEDNMLGVGAAARDLVAGAAGALERKGGPTIFESFLQSMNGLIPWISKQIDLPNTLGLKD